MQAVDNEHAPNRLIHETSPYLLEHAHNPVDWYPWGAEARARAKREDKPIFLSIGYSACHWCHVMARESFEDTSLAAMLNKHFVSIKVDREERPDLDEIYMAAVQIMTRRGGWPMSVFLTPELEPFYGGTYFPPKDRPGMPGFRTVLQGVIEAWGARRSEIARSAAELTRLIRQATSGPHDGAATLDASILEDAANRLQQTSDAKHGGFGGAPKFPPVHALGFLLRQWHRTRDAALLDMVTLTLDRMASGGVYDHLGGGFHRYSVDDRWLVPHFEKMLYDSAQLTQAYLEGYQATANPAYGQVARETLDYVLRDMTDSSGGFYSSEDADSEGEEGKFYLWTHGEVVATLGAEDAARFAQAYQVTPDGNFTSHEAYHARKNILHLSEPVTDAALGALLAPMCTKLLAARSVRPRPGRDEKFLTSWNALMISAFAKGHQVLGDERYRTAAVRAADFVLTQLVRDGQLLRTRGGGESRLPAFLDDYASMIAALLDVYESTFDRRWLAEANILARSMIERFWDGEAGGFFFTSDTHQGLIARTKPMYDGAEPSGNAVAALALMRLGRLVNNDEYSAKAQCLVEATAAGMTSAPEGHLRMLWALAFHLTPPKEIAIIGAYDSPEAAALLDALHSRFVPGKIIAFGNPEAEDFAEAEKAIPLLASKKPVSGRAAAYVCENYTCKAPVTTPEALLAALGEGPEREM